MTPLGCPLSHPLAHRRKRRWTSPKPAMAPCLLQVSHCSQSCLLSQSRSPRAHQEREPPLEMVGHSRSIMALRTPPRRSATSLGRHLSIGLVCENLRQSLEKKNFQTPSAWPRLLLSAPGRCWKVVHRVVGAPLLSPRMFPPTTPTSNHRSSLAEGSRVSGAPHPLPLVLPPT